MTHYTAALQDLPKLARDLDPGELSAILAEYKRLTHEAVEAERGLLDKFVGDQASAAWGGLPSQSPREAALLACRAALRQQQALAAYSASRGVALGLCVGIAGDPALSDALCRLCPSRGAGILVSRPVRELCALALRFEELKAEGPLEIFALKPAKA